MITKGKTTALTGLPIDEALFKSEHEIKDEQILKLINLSMDKKEQKKQQKKTVETKPVEEAKKQ